jgi:hypothetical protein
MKWLRRLFRRRRSARDAAAAGAVIVTPEQLEQLAVAVAGRRRGGGDCFAQGCRRRSAYRDIVELYDLTAPHEGAPAPDPMRVRLGLYLCERHAERLRLTTKGRSLRISIDPARRRKVDEVPKPPVVAP